MENICEWENCNELGQYRAPLEKDNSKNYKFLCKEHIKQFNKNWNYFDGMNQNEIENFLKADITWHRPTQKFSSSDNYFNILWNNALSDKFKIFKSEKKRKLLVTRDSVVQLCKFPTYGGWRRCPHNQKPLQLREATT